MKKTLAAAALAAAPLAAVMSTAPVHAVDFPVSPGPTSSPSADPTEGPAVVQPGVPTLTDGAVGLLGGLPVA